MISNIPASHLLRMVELSRQRFLHGLDCVPDERLDWSPGEAAGSPLRLAGRLAALLEHRSRILESQPGVPAERPTPEVPATREEARRLVDAAFARFGALAEGLSDADLERPVVAPWGAEVPAG